MGPRQRKSFFCDTACLFLMSRLIVNYFLSNCGGGPGLSICSGRPLMACNGTNVILKLMHFVLHWHSVPSKPPISQQAQQEGSPWGTLPVPPLEGVTCKLPLYGGREPCFLPCPVLCISLGAWQCQCRGGSDWWHPLSLTQYGNIAPDVFTDVWFCKVLWIQVLRIKKYKLDVACQCDY